MSHCGLVFPPGGGGVSVNYGFSSDKFTLHYITVDQIIRVVSRLGLGGLSLLNLMSSPLTAKFQFTCQTALCWG